MPVHYRPLTRSDFDRLVSAFNEAFSDYLVPMKVSAEQLEEMFRRRGWVPEVSVGAFEGERIVGFTCNGLDGGRAYDTGSGVVPSHRRTGIARRTVEISFELLRSAGAATYVLEVLEANTSAEALYRSLGFDETRRFQCWSYEARQGSRITELANADFDGISAWGDVEPSWQNSPASLRRARDNQVVLGNDEGAAVLFPWTGDLPLLAVSREHRRRGLGRRLLDAAATRANRPLRILNVDDRDAGIAAFLRACGATPTVRQIEMVRAL